MCRVEVKRVFNIWAVTSDMSKRVTKPTNWHVRLVKTLISLGIRPGWSVFAVCMEKAWVLSYPLSAQRWLWSDWADAQADLSLRRAHMHFLGYVMRWLKKKVSSDMCTQRRFNQPADLRNLIRIFTRRTSSCAQRRFWSDCVDAHADFKSSLSHMSEDTLSHVVARYFSSDNL